MSEETTLYRWFDADRVLLYVGISGNVARRTKEHERSKPWWSQVASCDASHYPTREEALEAEREAIVTEKPLYNVTHNERNGKCAEKYILTHDAGGYVDRQGIARRATVSDESREYWHVRWCSWLTGEPGEEHLRRGLPQDWQLFDSRDTWLACGALEWLKIREHQDRVARLDEKLEELFDRAEAG